MLPRMQKMWRNEPSHSQVNSHCGNWSPKWTSRIFRVQLKGLKLIALKSYLYHWKSIETWMSKMGSHDPFGHLKRKLWPKERPGVKLTIWLLTTKNQESTQFSRVQVVWNRLLESSQRGLQLCFKPHCNRRFARKVMGLQSRWSFNYGNSRTPTWESWDKMPFGCGPRGELQRIL
jgi:hypothetical protein